MLTLEPERLKNRPTTTRERIRRRWKGFFTGDAQAACAVSFSASKFSPFFHRVNVMAAIIAVPIRRGTDTPVLKPWNIAPPFRLGEKQVGTHQIGCVPWLLSRLTRPVALNFPIFAGLFFVVCHSAVPI